MQTPHYNEVLRITQSQLSFFSLQVCDLCLGGCKGGAFMAILWTNPYTYGKDNVDNIYKTERRGGWAVYVLAVLLAVLPFAVSAAPLRVSGIEVVATAGQEDIRLQLSQSVTYKTFFLKNPDRLVLDLPAAEWALPQALPAQYSGRMLRGLRVGRFNPTTTRVVFELAVPAHLQNASIKPASAGASLQLSLRGESTENALSAKPAAAKMPVSDDWVALAEKAQVSKPLPAGIGFSAIPVPVFKPSARTVKPIVVIDAGHGGQDPGAIGASGTHEKDITLAYARALNQALLRTGRYHVVLTRDDDRFIMLRGRLEIGRKAKGDVFISLHADSAENKDTQGFSIYTLSNTASDAEAAALATRENKVDLVYGLNLSNEQKDVTEILIDLAQRETMNKSSKLADILVANLSKGIFPLPNTHRYAGFAVLKAPDVPSVLIEIGFLSNKKDEAQIKTDAYRAKVVSSLVDGLDAYFASRALE